MAQAKSLTQTELEKVLTYITEHSNAKRNRAMLLLTTAGGLRVSEVSGLLLSDAVNQDGTIKSEIYLSANRVKHGNARYIYLNTRLQEELREYIDSKTWIDETQPLFTTLRGARKAFTANTLTQHFFCLYRKAGLQNSSHAGRKTFLTALANQGINVFVMAKLAGHRDIKTTMRYVTTGDDVLRRAVELV